TKDPVAGATHNKHDNNYYHLGNNINLQNGDKFSSLPLTGESKGIFFTSIGAILLVVATYLIKKISWRKNK
ncbi:LPXTG cell wall anchor domain-containing protein, partial [Lactococcus garvieae]|uniref:LPXTG cell wall anchor domain-containing protein n=1 Tax=Lactococcus garvieae TaxID=1363 RepID=UPI00398F60A6